jgi:hypothetical protein
VNCRRLSESGLAQLERLPALRDLRLTSANDATIKGLSTLKQLRTLSIHSAKVTDASVDIIAGLPNLESVTFHPRGVREAGEQRLHQLRPKLQIDRSYF